MAATRGHRAERRLPATLAGLAVLGFAVSSYLASFQLGLIGAVWDPFFATGSERVLTSTVSRLLPVPDATLGTAAYAADAIIAVALALRPDAPAWLPGLLALVATSGAIVGLVLVVLQPLVAESLCTLCLVSAGLATTLAVGAAIELRARLEADLPRLDPH
jgi:uncharacterized membrane protein